MFSFDSFKINRFAWSILLAGLMLAPVYTTRAQTPDLDQLISAAIEAHGGSRYNPSTIEFDFRGKHFLAQRDRWRFSFERTYQDETGRSVREVYNNKGITREINARPVTLTEKETNSLETVLNSVVYFAVLPYGLQGKAVQKKYLGQTTIMGEPYHKIEVTFQQEGGGRDWEDRFVYWIHKDRNTMDFLAYRFHVNDGGTRFREAVNVRTINGIRFADYINYTHSNEKIDIADFDRLFEQGEVDILSEVNLENVRVLLYP